MCLHVLIRREQVLALRAGRSGRFATGFVLFPALVREESTNVFLVVGVTVES
jgi:hypothetical protein